MRRGLRARGRRAAAGEHPGGQTCSAGVASWDGTESPIELFERMDEALYAAKAAGRDLAMLAPPSSRPRLRAVRVA